MTEKKPSSQEIQEIFNNIAPVYDQMNERLSFGIHKIWKLMAVKWCEPFSDSIALDLCCGSGDLTFLLANKVTHGKVIGVDFSAELLAIAKQKSKNKNHSIIDWVEADVLNLPFEDSFFDCATMGYGLRNVVDIPLCLKELHRVLKPNAKASMLDFHQPDNQIVKNFQQWYLENIVVTSALNLGVKNEYAYISPSLERFPNGDRQVELAKTAGFKKAVHYPLFGGIMGILVVTK